VLLKPELTFGLRNPEAQVEVERSEFPEDVAAGDCYEAEDEDGRPCCCSPGSDGRRRPGRQQPPLSRSTLRFEVLAARFDAASRLGAESGSSWKKPRQRLVDRRSNLAGKDLETQGLTG